MGKLLFLKNGYISYNSQEAYLRERINMINKGIDAQLERWFMQYDDAYTSGKLKRDIYECQLESINRKLANMFTMLNGSKDTAPKEMREIKFREYAL